VQARARAALGAASSLDGRPDAKTKSGHRAGDLRRLAAESADVLDKHGLDCGRAWALLLRAAVELLAENRAAALAHLRSAVDAFDRCEMKLYREGARWCLGNLLGPASGTELVREAENWMTGQGILNPAAMARMLAPGLTPG
jgi:hypothetical protein